MMDSPGSQRRAHLCLAIHLRDDSTTSDSHSSVFRNHRSCHLDLDNAICMMSKLHLFKVED